MTKGGTASALVLILLGTAVVLRTVRGQLVHRVKQIAGVP